MAAAGKIKIRFINSLDKIKGLSREEKKHLKPVCDKYAFKTNHYYLSLIDWNDPDDPIRRLVIPHAKEMDTWGRLDPSKEASYTKIPGLQHKYGSTALFLVSETCGSICRYCFRKRIFMKGKEGVLTDYKAALKYVREHREITNILLTGGDPLMLSTPKLEKIISGLREIGHVKIIRLGTKMPAFYPYRVLDDPSFIKMIKKYSMKDRRIYIITHFNNVKELTQPALRAVDKLLKAGAIIANQTPLIRGVNDSPKELAKLLDRLSFAGVPPYYVFQCRPTLANKDYAVPIEEGYDIYEKARSVVSGLAKRARFAMSAAKGKIHIIGKTPDEMILKYYRAARDKDSGRIIMVKRNPKAYWIDDYKEIKKDAPLFREFEHTGVY